MDQRRIGSDGALGEFELIARWTRLGRGVDGTRLGRGVDGTRLGRDSDGAEIIAGVGDDCAVLRERDALLRLVTMDMLLEGVHFLREHGTLEQLGHKAITVSLSDVAAMGGLPREAYVGLGIERSALSVADLDALYRGIHAACDDHGVALLGGDTTASRTGLVLSITVVGDVEPARVLLRSTARSGDDIYVTGTLGDAAAGLHCLTQPSTTAQARPLPAITARHEAPNAGHGALVDRFLSPRAHVAEARVISASGQAHAMIDLSDGLSSDLGHICDASGLGFTLQADTLPRSPALVRYCAMAGLDPFALALDGGEDYVLLVTGTAELHAACRARDVELVRVGVLHDNPERVLVTTSGARQPLLPRGFDHFRPGP